MATDVTQRTPPANTPESNVDALERCLDDAEAALPSVIGPTFNFRPGCAAVIAALRESVSCFRAANRDFTRTVNDAHGTGTFRVIAATATEQAGQKGPDALAAAKKELGTKLVRGWLSALNESMAPRANAIADKIDAAVGALRTAIERAGLQCQLPLAMRPKGAQVTSPTELYAQVEKREQVRALVRRDIAQFEWIYKQARDVDEAIAAELRAFACSSVDEISTGTTTPRPHKKADDQATASRLAALFKMDDANATIPPELQNAAEFYERLELVVRKVVGVDWSLGGGLSSGEFDRALQNGSLVRDVNDSARLDSWPTRFLGQPGQGRVSIGLKPWEPLPFEVPKARGAR